eukprot:tig00021318_g20133.t1
MLAQVSATPAPAPIPLNPTTRCPSLERQQVTVTEYLGGAAPALAAELAAFTWKKLEEEPTQQPPDVAPASANSTHDALAATPAGQALPPPAGASATSLPVSASTAQRESASS